MDESALAEQPKDPLAEALRLAREVEALKFDNAQLRHAALVLVRRGADLERALLDAGLAVARESHRDQENRKHWSELLRRINVLLR